MSIGGSAFRECSSLASVSIPEGVTSIEDSAFFGCSSLKSISISGSVMSIGDSAFAGCSSLVSISIPGSVTSIGSWAFRDCSGLTSISIPEGVTSIEGWEFSGCSSLRSISIPGSVTSIEVGAFYECSSLRSISIPGSVTSIEVGAFAGCSSLTSITVDEKNPKYDSRENCNAIIEIETNTLMTGCSNTTIPGSVTSIGHQAFYGCSSLRSISIPGSVTSIGWNAFYECNSLVSISIPESVTSIGYRAFEGCSNLTSITVNEKNPKYDSRNHCNAIIETETNTLIAGCSNTIIPESVTSIGGYAFDGHSGLTSINIPESVTSIGYCAFSGCGGLTSISLPESVMSIGPEAFRDCSSLTNVSIPASLTSIGYAAFSGCSSQLTLLVEKGSYAETYAKENFLKYRTVYTLDASEKPTLSKVDMAVLIEKNAENDIVITTDTGVTFTFAKGTMEAVDTAENYNFNTVISLDFTQAGLSDSVKKEDFVAKVSYQYLGKLPAEAEIKLPVGKEYAGKSVLYSEVEADGTLGEGQRAVVDAEGFLTVKQTYCADYVVTLVEEEDVIAVTDIIGVPTEMTAGETIALTGTVTPDNATNKTIKWSVKDAGSTGASISENKLTATAEGSVVVTATIEKGISAEQAFTKDFTIEVKVKKTEAYMPGDVDHDGTITSDDALWILMKVAGKDTNGKYHEDTADCDGKKDGVTSDDALWILMKVAGKV